MPKWFNLGVRAAGTDRPADPAATLRLLLAAACDPLIAMGIGIAAADDRLAEPAGRHAQTASALVGVTSRIEGHPIHPKALSPQPSQGSTAALEPAQRADLTTPRAASNRWNPEAAHRVCDGL